MTYCDFTKYKNRVCPKKKNKARLHVPLLYVLLLSNRLAVSVSVSVTITIPVAQVSILLLKLSAGCRRQQRRVGSLLLVVLALVDLVRGSASVFESEYYQYD